jgi:hypothetical protein
MRAGATRDPEPGLPERVAKCQPVEGVTGTDCELGLPVHGHVHDLMIAARAVRAPVHFPRAQRGSAPRRTLAVGGGVIS